MKKFMDEDFLLQTKTAQKLYHEYAESQPIFDYHCHLDPREIANNIRFDNISAVWLGTRTFGDHYKWRQMRTNGLTEQVDDPWVKFESWAKTLEKLLGNPLYHWTHLELQRYFGITEPLCAANAKEIYDKCNRILAEDPNFDVFGIFKKFNVYAVGTTDDPADTLEYHLAVKGKSPAKVLPSYRPDKAMNIDAEGFAAYIEKLGKAADMKLESAEDVLKALEKRLDFFIEVGCRASDHALVDAPYAPAPVSKVNEIFCRVMNGGEITAEEAEMYRFYIMTGLGRAYAKRGVAMQLHFAAIRNNNSAKFKALGADTGYDAVSNSVNAAKLAKFLDSMEADGLLPKTILYSLNPNDYYVLGTLMGCFQGDIPGKIQLGSAWWFCDHRDGMEQQIKTLGNLGTLTRFIGMLTDSRSFLSYPRHEYFRRILCNILGTWAEEGEIPSDMKMLGKVVEDISFKNAQHYFEG
ncbi:MAG: glucuronate isomerase [Sphaerochaetaceae bacterium]|nr:glucuronate isomerase [Sphaerochaetaceae bacterium]